MLFLDPSLCGLLGMPRAELLSDPARDFWYMYAMELLGVGCASCTCARQGRAATGLNKMK